MLSVVVPIETQPTQCVDGRLPFEHHSWGNQPQEQIIRTSQPASSTQTNPADLDIECQGLDKALVTSFKQLLQLYSAKMSSTDTHPVSSGGLQQYITKSSRSQGREQKPMTESQPSRSTGSPFTTFFDLPENAQLHIFSFLGIKDLCRISGVCWHWNNMASDNLLWRRRLEKDSQNWEAIGYTTNPYMYQECQSDWSYKEIYLRCSPEVNHLIKQTNVGFHHLSSLLRAFWPKKTPKLAMFGPGLESSTSSLTRKILEDKSGLFVTTGMFPGQFEGVGSGFTLKMSNTIVFNLVTLYTSTRAERQGLAPSQRMQHNRLLGHAVVAAEEGAIEEEEEKVAEIRQPVKDLCRTLDGFVFVVDASQDAEAVSQSRAELLAMVNEHWSSPSLPLVILSCTPDSTTPRRWSCLDIISKLRLGELNRPWQVRDCVVEGMAGVESGMEWAVEQAHRR